jgi:hypothetical protein
MLLSAPAEEAADASQEDGESVSAHDFYSESAQARFEIADKKLKLWVDRWLSSSQHRPLVCITPDISSRWRKLVQHKK